MDTDKTRYRGRSHGEAGEDQPTEEELLASQTLRQVAYEKERRQRFVERMVFFSILVLGAGIFGMASYYDVSVVKVLQAIEGKDTEQNIVANCRKPENRNTPYCQERAASTQSSWRGITRGDSKDQVFTLHGR